METKLWIRGTTVLRKEIIINHFYLLFSCFSIFQTGSDLSSFKKIWPDYIQINSCGKGLRDGSVVVCLLCRHEALSSSPSTPYVQSVIPRALLFGIPGATTKCAISRVLQPSVCEHHNQICGLWRTLQPRKKSVREHHKWKCASPRTRRKKSVKTL